MGGAYFVSRDDHTFPLSGYSGGRSKLPLTYKVRMMADNTLNMCACAISSTRQMLRTFFEETKACLSNSAESSNNRKNLDFQCLIQAAIGLHTLLCNDDISPIGVI